MIIAKMRGNSNNLLLDLAKYSLDHQWDLIKHNSTKSAAVMGITATILSLYLGIQITDLHIFNIITNLICTQNIAATIIYILTFFILILSLIFSIIDLMIFRFGHIDPVEAIYHLHNKTHANARDTVTKDIAEIWYSNQFKIATKNKYRRRSFYLLSLGIILMIVSVICTSLC
jgi:hypothetical protein